MSKTETPKPAAAATTEPPAPATAAGASPAAAATEHETIGAEGEDRIAYRVTAAAGPRVAGVRAKVGQKFWLTEAEAIGELATGAITLWDKPKSA